jgi:hypothetical protein
MHEHKLERIVLWLDFRPIICSHHIQIREILIHFSLLVYRHLMWSAAPASAGTAGDFHAHLP